MQRYKMIYAAALTVAAFVIAGCGDQSPTGPPDAGFGGKPQLEASLLSASGTTVTAVRWSSTHQAGQHSVSGTVGILGGTLSIPKADFTLTIPPLALAKSTKIKVTALKGAYVQYDMEPHGLRFAVPVFVRQGLRNTKAYEDPILAKSIFGIYVAGDTPPGPTGLITATEILPSQTIWFLLNGVLLPDSQIWELNHFSRYMLASG